MNGRRPAARYWPWALGLAVTAVAVWLAVSFTDRWGPPEPADPAMEAVTPADPQVPPDPQVAPPGREPATGAAAEELIGRTEEMRAAVRRYEEGCAARLEPAAGAGLGDLVGECVEHLAVAIDAIVASDTVGQVVIDDQMERYRRQLDRLWSAEPGQRAAPTRELLESVTGTLEVIAAQRYPQTLGGADAVREPRSALESIDAGRPLAQQEAPVRRYFQATGAVLSAMARPGDPGPS